MQHYDYFDMLIRRAAEALRAALGQQRDSESEALDAARRWVAGKGPDLLASLPGAVVLGLLSVEPDPGLHGRALAEQAALAEAEGSENAAALWRHAAALLARDAGADAELVQLVHERVAGSG